MKESESVLTRKTDHKTPRIGGVLRVVNGGGERSRDNFL